MRTAILVKTVDPLGNVSFATYDSNGNLTSLTGPDRLDDDVHLRRQGQPDEQHGPAGPDHVLHLHRHRQPAASVTDAQGDTTSYSYDANGDLTSTEYPDDTVETATYDALGDPLSLTDPRRPGHAAIPTTPPARSPA